MRTVMQGETNTTRPLAPKPAIRTTSEIGRGPEGGPSTLLTPAAPNPWETAINRSKQPMIPLPFNASFATNVPSPMGPVSMSPGGQIGPPAQPGEWRDAKGMLIRDMQKYGDGWLGVNAAGQQVYVDPTGNSTVATGQTQAQPWADLTRMPGSPPVQPPRPNSPFGSFYGRGGGGGGGYGGGDYSSYLDRLANQVMWNIV